MGLVGRERAERRRGTERGIETERIPIDRPIRVAAMRIAHDHRTTTRARAHLAHPRTVRQQQEIYCLAREECLHQRSPACRERRPARPLATVELEIQVRHRVAAHHHRHVAPAGERPRMRQHAMTERGDRTREILVRMHRRMSMIAHDHELKCVGTATTRGVVLQACNGVVDHAKCIEHAGRVLPQLMRELVDAGMSEEHQIRALGVNTRTHSCAHACGEIAFEPQPSLHIAAKVMPRDPRPRDDPRAEPLRLAQSAADRRERRDRPLGELE